jgi:hypothetical protein
LGHSLFAVDNRDALPMIRSRDHCEPASGDAGSDDPAATRLILTE